MNIVNNAIYEKRAQHERIINGSSICYETVARDVPVTDDGGKVLGTAFFYEYIRTDVTDSLARPVVFAYNGGPGASAVWLHSGFLAPVRYALTDAMQPEFSGEAKLEENPCCLLDQCDIVLIDPPGVGYGTITDPANAGEVFGCEQDAKFVAQVIERWLVEHDRLHSPIYLLGESYGTVRNCLVADILTGGPFIPGMSNRAIPVAGIIMMGNAVSCNPSMMIFNEKDVSATALMIPTMAAIRWYHTNTDARTETLKERVSRAYTFVAEKYGKAVYLGNRMDGEEQEAVIRELSELTGMLTSDIRKRNLKLDSEGFRNSVLEGRTVSAYDGRMSLAYTDGKLDAYADDAVLGPFGYLARNAFDQICRSEFQMDLKRSFSSVDFAVNGAWDYKVTTTPFESLCRCLRRNANLRVLFANGVYDMTTTIGQTAYMAAHITTARPGQVLVREYPAGHMAYIGRESARMLNTDFRTFLL